MKKSITVIAIVALAFISLTSQAPKPKDYTVTLSLPEWQAVMAVIDNSNANHLQVKEVQNLIVPQLQKQLADTTAPKKK
jgi:hypothetical protein